MDHQDWKPVVLKKSYAQLKKEGKIPPKEKVLVPKRPNSNSTQLQNAWKLDGEDAPPPKYVPKETSKLIQQARVAQKLSQQDLANKLCVKKNVINDLESGKMLLDKSFISRVKKTLRIN